MCVCFRLDDHLVSFFPVWTGPVPHPCSAPFVSGTVPQGAKGPGKRRRRVVPIS